MTEPQANCLSYFAGLLGASVPRANVTRICITYGWLKDGPEEYLGGVTITPAGREALAAYREKTK